MQVVRSYIHSNRVKLNTSICLTNLVFIKNLWEEKLRLEVNVTYMSLSLISSDFTMT